MNDRERKNEINKLTVEIKKSYDIIDVLKGFLAEINKVDTTELYLLDDDDLEDLKSIPYKIDNHLANIGECEERIKILEVSDIDLKKMEINDHKKVIRLEQNLILKWKKELETHPPIYTVNNKNLIKLSENAISLCKKRIKELE